MKPSELTGQKLDRIVHDLAHPEEPIKDGCLAPPYSSDWCFGGPIIEREFIELLLFVDDGSVWFAHLGAKHFPLDAQVTGPTPLIAAMRCFVASKLGEEIDVPEEMA